MEIVAKIRRLHLADRLSIRSITRKTGLSRNTIRKYLRSNEVQPRYRLNSPRPSRRLVEHEVRLQDLYAADAPTFRARTDDDARVLRHSGSGRV